MTTIPGASRFLATSTLANSQGLPAQSSNFLGEATGGIGLLEIGRGNRVPGIGISSRARLLNAQQIDRSSDINQLFSLSGGASATIEAAQIQIAALRSTAPASQLHSSVVEVEDDGGVAASETGQNIDTEA